LQARLLFTLNLLIQLFVFFSV